MMQRRAFLAAAGALAAAAEIPLARAKEKGAASSTCGQSVVPSAAKSRFAPLISGKTPGLLLSREEIAVSIAGARAWKVRYLSEDVNGVLHEVSGLVIAPTAAGKNRKLLTWCHGTTGLGDAACPSAQPDPVRDLITYFDATSTQQIDYGVPGLQGWIQDGYLVCATDYQGQGTPGQHQYEVNRTQARDAVHLCRVALQMNIGAGTRFGCAGWSQGGGAAAAVAELDANDYGDLELVGSVVMSPVTTADLFDSTGGPSAMGSDPSKPPEVHVAMMLAGVQSANPHTLKLSDFFTPLGVEIIETSWNIQPVHHIADTIDRLCLLRGPVLQAKPTNLAAWRAAVAAASGATRKAIAPMLLCIDNGVLNPLAYQQGLAKSVKALGGSIETRSYPKDDHFSLPKSCAPDARAWLNGFF